MEPKERRMNEVIKDWDTIRTTVHSKSGFMVVDDAKISTALLIALKLDEMIGSIDSLEQQIIHLRRSR